MANPVKVEITGDAKSLFDTLHQSTAGLKGFASEVNAMGTSMSKVLGNIQAPLIALAGLVGGTSFLKGTVAETKDWTIEASKLARTLGITTEEASVFGMAISRVYGDADTFLSIAAKMTRTLNSNEEAFHNLGISTRDSSGHLRNSRDVMLDTFKALSEMKIGTDRNVASTQIFGKGWLEVQKYLKINEEALRSAREETERLNLIVGSDAVQATSDYRAASEKLDVTLKALKIRIGQELMPVMTQFNNAAAEEGPSALKVLGGALRSVFEILDGIWSGFKMFAVGLVGVIRAIYETAVAILNPIWGFLTGGIPGFKREWALANKDLTVHWQDTVNALNEIGDAYTMRQMTRWGELQAAQKKSVALQGGGNYAETGSGREAVDAEKKVRKAIEAERLRHYQRMAAIDSADVLRGQEERRKDNAWLIKEMEDEEKRKAEQIRKDHEAASQIFGYTGKAGASRAVDEYLIESQDAFKRWKDMVTGVINGVENAFASGFTGILTFQMKLADGLRSIWKGISQSIIGELSKVMAKQVMNWGLEKAMALWRRISTKEEIGLQAEKTAATVTGSVATTAAAGTEAAASTTATGANIGKATSGFFSAYAGIPWVGIAMALAGIAVMMAVMNSITAHAVGGLINKPTLSLMGEAGPELVAPEHDFKDWAYNLSANVLASQQQAQGYQRLGSSYASTPNAGGGGQTVLNADGMFRGAIIMDTSKAGMTRAANYVLKTLAHAQGTRGVVLRPGSVLGGI
ncbi:phage tail tape measure C-terminal domain-containing protein [Geothrix sp. 21YS21S-2]|uniref:phage tail tape measure C-terminal domain-containing protein n=1 Tax=Geothrix sp. 21YS21S-2 TaxID=3068893 RepID=UPI0027B9F471|nr:phage tail tape measure C-terminal domain-containing protein [Geothrix sp. 21YS21S-2]